MIVGSEKLSEQVEKVLANIERSEDGELVEIDEVILVVAVHYGSDPDEESETGALFYRCTSARFHVQYGLLEQAEYAVANNQRTAE